MEQVIRITALCVVAALLALVIRRGTPELALLLAVGCTVVVLLSLAEPVRAVLLFLEELGERSGVSRELFDPLWKTVGISFVVKLGGELCRDAGESAMAAVVESAGAVCALLVALPLLRAVLSQIVGLMQ
jgi:stage III sporulation protein AD